MTCEKIVDLLSEYSAGELRAEQHQEVRLHLEACPACDRTRRQLERTWELLGEFDELEPPPTFRAQVWERIRQEKPATSWGWGWKWLTRAGLATAALGLVLVGGLFLRPPATPDAPAPVAVSESADQELAALAPQWELDPVAELPDTLDAPAEDSHLEPLQLGQLSDSWLDEAHDVLGDELGGS